MSVDRAKFKAEAQACLGQSKPAGELVECVQRHFPDVQVNREKDDLVIKGGTRFLVVSATGRTAFASPTMSRCRPPTLSMPAAAVRSRSIN